MDFHKLLKTAINTSIKGGKEILKIYDTNFDVEYKGDNSPLTIADKNCNKIIENNLKQTGIPILSEEGASIAYSERKEWEYFWLVDPLDGTKEFIKRNGEFTVNIALICSGVPIMGVVYVPVKRELYFALEGLGSYKIKIDKIINNLSDLILKANRLPIDFNRNTYVIVGSRSHMSSETEGFFQDMQEKHKNIEILTVGSSLKLCMVAEGKADAYPRYAPTMEWDTGAGDAICRMAGFNVLEYSLENPLRYNKEELLNPWFLVK